MFYFVLKFNNKLTGWPLVLHRAQIWKASDWNRIPPPRPTITSQSPDLRYNLDYFNKFQSIIMLTKISNLLSLQKSKMARRLASMALGWGQSGLKGRNDAGVLSSRENYLESWEDQWWIDRTILKNLILLYTVGLNWSITLIKRLQQVCLQRN